MSPDDRVIVPIGHDEAESSLDPVLAALDGDLRRAGDRVRRANARDGRERPDDAWARGLRARLLAEAAAVPARAGATGSLGASSGGPAVVAGAARTSVAHRDGAPVATDYRREPGQVAPRVARRTPTILPAPRWSVLAIAAVLVASVLGLNADRLFPVPAPARVADAAGATLARAGTTAPLAPGTELLAGDTVTVGPDGRAALVLGGGAVRLDAGAVVRIDRLADGVALQQLAGRAWHRVDVTAGTTYTVATGPLRWTALGTAFDLTWLPGGDAVRLLTVQHEVALAGPDLALRVAEGRAAVVGIGGAAPGVAVDGVTARDLRDPWLVANARLDLAAGYEVGWLTTAGLDPTAAPTHLPAGTPAPATDAPPTPGATATSALPAPTVTPSPAATPRPTPSATATPTPVPTVKPTPTPAPSPVMAALSVDAVACGGAVLLTWTGDPGPSFHHWTALRAASDFAVPVSYPPPAGVTGLGASFSKNVAARTFADTSLAPGATAWYRAVGWSADDRSIAASPATSVKGKDVVWLGTTGATPRAGGADVSWSAYGGPAACFTYYKVTWSASTSKPSYLGSHDGSHAVGGQTETATSVSLPSGTWWIRVEAIVATDYGKAVVGASEPVQLTVP